MNTSLLNFLAAVAIIITVAKLSGYISIRLGQPSVLGELIAGLILGPTMLNMLETWPSFAADPGLSESITLMAEIGVLLLMFLAGLELDIGDLLRSGRVAGLAGSFGVVVPLVTGFATARLFGVSVTESIFIGLALSATSVSISAQTLMELGVLRSKVGLAMLGAAVFDDILVVLLLSAASLFLGSGTVNGAGSVGVILVRMVAFLTLAAVVGLFLLPRSTSVVADLPVSRGVTAFALVICLVFAYGSETLGGIASITGAFLAGLFFARTNLVGEIESGLGALAYGFFVPIFFVNIGLHANLRAISGQVLFLAIALTIVAVVSKVVGSGLGAAAGGFGRKDALRLGIGMISRGEVGLIVATVALTQMFIERETFSVIVFMVIVATLITPVLLRAVYREPTPELT